ncbi:MAG: hypothetical protein ACO3EZ_02325 [Prochlorotrichaceae cyanobacterium]
MPISRRHLIRSLTLGSSATIATAAWQLPSQAQEPTAEGYTWTLVSVWDVNSFLYPYLERFVTQVERQTQGQLRLKLAVPNDPRSILGQVGAGKLEMGHGMPLLWESQLPAAPYLMSVPFGLTAEEQWLWLTQGGGQALADEIYGAMGCKYFPGGNLGLSGGGWFKTEITDLSALMGLKINSSGLAASVWQGVGAEVLTLPLADLQRQFANDRLEAVEYVGPQQDLQAQLHQSAPFYYFPGWQRPGTLLDFFIHLDTWQALPVNIQAGLEAAIVAFNQTLLHEQIYQNQQALRLLTSQHGVQLRTFPESVLLRLESLTGQVLQERARANDRVAAVVEHLIQFRSNLLPWVQTVELSYLNARRWTWTL